MSLKKFSPLTQERITRYAKLSGDDNPIHQDDSFAKSAGLPSTIAHGMLSLGLATSALQKAGVSMADIKALECKFRDMVFESEAVEASVEKKEEGVWEVLLKKQNGKPVLSLTART